MFSSLALRRYLKAGMVLLLVLGLGYGCWLLIVFFVTAAPYYGEEGGPLTRPDVPVSIDLTRLPSQPNEQDFATLAQSVMERETRLQGFQMDFMRWNMSCDADVYKPSRVAISGEWQGEVDATQVRIVKITMSFEKHMNTIGIEDFTGDKSPTHSTSFINWSAVQQHVDEIFVLTEEQGGREYRQEIQNDCQIDFFLDDKEWFVRYSSSDLEKLGFCAVVNHQTGAYTGGRVEKSGDGCESVLINQP